MTEEITRDRAGMNTNCRNCGAPMEPMAHGRYAFCTHCGTFEFPQAPPVDGVQVIDRPSPSPSCPACAAPLVNSRLDGTVSVRHCEQCRGLLIACADFADVVARRRARASGAPATPVPLDPRELKRQLACPVCHETMDVHPYYGPGNVVIDTCSRCNLVWVDGGELQQITDAPGRDRRTRF
ncbi:MAG TPA: zf-TFIIB domain-containing protein [Vicinamibacterales bacterium]